MRYRLLVTSEALVPPTSHVTSFPVFGRVQEREGLIQVLTADPLAGLAEVGRVSTQSETGLPLESSTGRVFLALPRELPRPEDIDIVAVGDGLQSRRTLEAGALFSKAVTFVGVGSLGSLLAILLAQAGVGTFRLLDPDDVDAANLSRHACDLADLGRRKVTATAELLRRRCVQAAAFDADVLELPPQDFDAMIAGSDLVVASTDRAAAQFVVNDACVRTGIPGLFVGCYRDAAGGEVIPARPDSPCLFCAVGFRAELGAVAPKERTMPYRDGNDADLAAEPGLSVDIAFVAAVAAAHALALLVPESARAGLLSPDALRLCHGGSEPGGELAELFRSPFECVTARVRREEPCPVCGWTSAGGTTPRA